MRKSALSEITTLSFAGRWRFYDDGWPGLLSLEIQAEDRLTGTFYSDRFRVEYSVTATVSRDAPHAIRLSFHNYNWLPRQDYFGFLFTVGKNTIAGYSYWRSERYGFVAFRHPAPIPGNFRPGPVDFTDFLGDWRLNLDGDVSDVEFTYDRKTGVLAGRSVREGAPPRRLSCKLASGPVGHAIHLITSGQGTLDPPEVSLHGYLFTRPKGTVAGHASVAGHRAGFYLLRCR